jgi:hypothetical protein
MDMWTGGMAEPMESIWSQEEDTELLLNAEIEPDADGDGYGDLTQDCFPNHPGDQELCGRDFAPPTIRPLFSARQGFLRSGVILARVTSNESGIARAVGRLHIKGRGARTYALPTARKSITAGVSTVLRLRVRKPALKAARVAARDGKNITVTVRVGVMDAAGNEGQVPIRIRPRQVNQ